MVFPDFLSTEQAANHIRETFKGVTRPPRLLPKNYQDLCPYFDLAVVEEVARDFCILEMIQAVFYAMVVNEALELGVLSGDLAEHLKSALEGLQCLINTPFYGRNTVDRSIQEWGRERQAVKRRAQGRVTLHPLLAMRSSHREPKKIPYVVLIHEPDTPSWCSCEYSSTPSILSIEKEVICPWKVDVAVSHMIDVQEHKLARTKTILRLKTPNELMAKEYYEGNSHSSLGSHRMGVDVATASTSSSTRGSERGLSSSCPSFSRSKRGRAQEELIYEVASKGTVFSGDPKHSNLKMGCAPISPTLGSWAP
ncbi:hypothetical protein Cgig2_011328 [Carnegiea gigantea]|uniref:Uncharacterized protein n=1 Tax=Carnegiea gigantea TaxID=171969 RepID=A0A9Q1QH04_9CARY|nr:hypothetical protein Cgig2_011328 [Carnegiea gigantea]